MTSVQTMAELLDECQQLGDEEREYVEILKKSLARMNQVINDLIQSNQEETTQLQRKLPVQISKALNEALSLHIEGLENKTNPVFSKRKQIVCDIARKLPYATA